MLTNDLKIIDDAQACMLWPRAAMAFQWLDMGHALEETDDAMR